MSFFQYARIIKEWLPVKMLQSNYYRKLEKLYHEMLDKKRHQAIKQHGFEALAKIHELCVANNISYWLYAGTLLAAIRENSILLKDDADMDIGLWYDPNEQQKIEEILTSHGFTKNHHFEVEGNILESRIEYKGVGIDLFYFIKEGLQSYESSFAPIPEVSMEKRYPVRAHYKTEDLVNTKLIRVKGVDLSVPVNPEGVLESLYGDWQTPIPRSESIPYQRPNQIHHKDIQADVIKFSPSVHK